MTTPNDRQHEEAERATAEVSVRQAMMRSEDNQSDQIFAAVMALYDALRDSTARGKEEKRDPKGHVLYKRGDKDAPDSIKDSNGDIALGLCRNCHRGEIELDEPCDAKPTPVADKEEKRPIRHSEKLGELSPQAREDRLPSKPLWAAPREPAPAPSLPDEEVETKKAPPGWWSDWIKRGEELFKEAEEAGP